MARGRRWTYREDREIRQAAEDARRLGLSTLGGLQPGHGRLRQVAARIDRTYAAVRKRASRLQARSYLTTQQEREARAALAKRLAAEIERDIAEAEARFRAEAEKPLPTLDAETIDWLQRYL